MKRAILVADNKVGGPTTLGDDQLRLYGIRREIERNHVRYTFAWLDGLAHDELGGVEGLASRALGIKRGLVASTLLIDDAQRGVIRPLGSAPSSIAQLKHDDVIETACTHVLGRPVERGTRDYVTHENTSDRRNFLRLVRAHAEAQSRLPAEGLRCRDRSK